MGERANLDRWSSKSLFLPGGILLLATTALLNIHWSPIALPALNFYYAAAFLAGLLMAGRFHSTRVFFTLIVLWLAERALAFFSAAPPASPAPARIALAAIATLLPANFLAFAFIEERGFTAPATVSRLFFIFLQSVFVALVCRPDQAAGPNLLTTAFFPSHWFVWTRLPQLALLLYLLSAITLLLRFTFNRKPLEGGFFWALLATGLALQAGGLGREATAYMGTSALILVAAVVENSYRMAYHDELTGLPGRRAFNEILLGLESHYAIAIVDIDHFKSFNDTYGHETGDEVLRMVASRLAAVTGGGKAFRCGGEEFAIVFLDKSAKDAREHLELLRATIQTSAFQIRGRLDRRKVPRSPDDRRQPARKKHKLSAARAGNEVSVTVSIGVAEPSTRNHKVDQVISAADNALYCAKQGGRNRVELDGSPTRHPNPVP